MHVHEHVSEGVRKARRGCKMPWNWTASSREQLQQVLSTWGWYSQKYKLKRSFLFFLLCFHCCWCCFPCFGILRLDPSASHTLGMWSPETSFQRSFCFNFLLRRSLAKLPWLPSAPNASTSDRRELRPKACATRPGSLTREYQTQVRAECSSQPEA